MSSMHLNMEKYFLGPFFKLIWTLRPIYVAPCKVEGVRCIQELLPETLGKTLSFGVSVTHRTYGFTSHLNDKAIMDKFFKRTQGSLLWHSAESSALDCSAIYCIALITEYFFIKVLRIHIKFFWGAVFFFLDSQRFDMHKKKHYITTIQVKNPSENKSV